MNDVPAILGGKPILDQEVGIVRPSIADYATQDLMDGIKKILDSNMVTNGSTVSQLESEMAEYLEVDHVVAVSSCTLGQTLSIRVADLQGGKIILPSFTIAATANAAYWNNCEIEFVDVDLNTFNVSLEHLEELMDHSVDAIMPVHVFGNPCQIDEIEALANKYGARVLYDSAQGFGSQYKGKKLGGNGLLEVFSGSPTKHFTSIEGGFVATSDAGVAERLRLARNYGVLPNYDCVVVGLNARMPEINALVGLRMLHETDLFIANRNRYAAMYQEMLSDLPGLRFQQITENSYSSYNYLGILIESSEFGLSNRELAKGLEGENIHTKVYYHPPVHMQTAYSEISKRPLPNTEYIAERIICLPIYNFMDESLIEAICTATRRLFEHSSRVRGVVAGEVAVA